jgi:hypothetical protein
MKDIHSHLQESEKKAQELYKTFTNKPFREFYWDNNPNKNYGKDFQPFDISGETETFGRYYIELKTSNTPLLNKERQRVFKWIDENEVEFGIKPYKLKQIREFYALEGQPDDKFYFNVIFPSYNKMAVWDITDLVKNDYGFADESRYDNEDYEVVMVYSKSMKGTEKEEWEHKEYIKFENKPFIREKIPLRRQ